MLLVIDWLLLMLSHISNFCLKIYKIGVLQLYERAEPLSCFPLIRVALLQTSMPSDRMVCVPCSVCACTSFSFSDTGCGGRVSW